MPLLPKNVGAPNVLHRVTVGMSVCGRRYLKYKRAGPVSFRLVDITFREKNDFGVFRHFDFPNCLKSFSSKIVRFEAFRSKTFVAHDFFQHRSACCFFIVWVIPFFHRFSLFVVSFAGGSQTRLCFLGKIFNSQF